MFKNPNIIKLKPVWVSYANHCAEEHARYIILILCYESFTWS